MTQHTDIAIVGGGLAGSLAAAMLGRAGIDTVVIDPHPVYPADFRCEKLDGPQMAILQKTGIADAVLKASTPDRESWVARMGRIVEKRPGDQQGIMYDTLVNTLRAEIPASTPFVHAKAKGITTGANCQIVELSNGDMISARLVVLANGLNIGLRHKLGMGHRVISEAHSISIGFDMKPRDRHAFEFPALTYYFERPSERMAYLTMFPIGSVMRANLMGYRYLQEPWLRALRDAPQETLFAAMPGLKSIIGPFEVTDSMKVRPVDLYVTDGHRQPGVVLVGDAFATSCPAAGTGAGKAFTDVERLCNVHIPQWLATPGMGVEKIAAFYDDPVKRAYDAHSLAKAYQLRSFSIDPGLHWQARRAVKYAVHWARGALRPASAGASRHAPERPGAPAASSAAS